MESAIDKMHPLQDYNNLLMAYRNLEASILAFGGILYNASLLENREGEEASYWLDVYKTHFNLTSERHGQTNI
jgi:hypothetical protein